MSSRAAIAVGIAVGLSALAATPVRAGDEGPVFVIPTRPGIPVVINGVDASYAVVEGDWGLARPGAVPVTVIGGSPLLPNAVYSRRNSYHPRYGRAPQRGRQEIEPAADRALPDPAESFSRSWSTSSDVTPVNNAPDPAQGRAYPNDAGETYAPATITDPATFPNLNNVAPVIIAPRRRP
jgi:hypothetical protein